MVQSDDAWYRVYFDEHYLHRYRPLLTDERSEREVDGIVDLLGLEPGDRVLDLACGHGRHAIRLARRGLRVTGFDLSEVFLERARADARTEGLAIDYVHGDMRELPWEGAFDAVINVFTAFGYLEDDAEDAKALQAVGRALRPGGRLLQETLHRDGLTPRFLSSYVERLDDGLITLHEHRLDLAAGGVEDTVTEIEVDGRRIVRRTWVRLYTVPEFRRMYEAAGLSLDAAYGGLDGGELTLASRRLVLVGSKPPATP